MAVLITLDDSSLFAQIPSKTEPQASFSDGEVNSLLARLRVQEKNQEQKESRYKVVTKLVSTSKLTQLLS